MAQLSPQTTPRSSRRVWLAPGLWGAAVGLSVWSHEFATSERLLKPAGAMIGAAILLALVARFVSGRLMDGRLIGWSARRQSGCVLGALVAGAVTVAAVPVTLPSPPWVPVSELTVTALGRRNAASHSSEVWVDGIAIDTGQQVGVHEFTNDGRWEYRGLSAISCREQPAVLGWRGRISGGCRLVLHAHGWSGLARIRWNGTEQVVDLYAPESMLRPVPLPAVPIRTLPARLYQGLVAVSDAVALGGLFWVVAVLLVSRKPRAPRPTAFWRGVLLYACICAVVWTVCLLAYWPALMTSDSIDQWEQVLGSDFWDEHPAFGTILLWTVAHLWRTPAVAGFLQIPALGLVCGWGIAEMRRMGAPRWLGGLMCALVAFSPVNAPMVVTFWKDVLFSTALLWLGLLVLKVVASRGEWTRSRGAWLSLGVAGAMTTLLRHNGLAPAVGTLVLLIVAYRREWRGLVAALCCCVLLVGGVKIGLYRAMAVHPSRIKGWIYLPLHEIGAHMAAGTPIRDDERPVLRFLRDADNWPYSPYWVNPLIYDGHFSYARAQEHGSEAIRLALQLSRRNPRVSVRRLLAISSLVWRITIPPDSICPTVLGVRDGGAVAGIVPAPNRLGVTPNPILPGVRERLADLITASMRPEFVLLFWRPAVYLYLLLAAAAVAAARCRNWRYWLVAAPAAINSAVIALMTPAQDFRYQYGVYLTGLMLGPFLLWAARQTDTAADPVKPGCAEEPRLGAFEDGGAVGSRMNDHA